MGERREVVRFASPDPLLLVFGAVGGRNFCSGWIQERLEKMSDAAKKEVLWLQMSASWREERNSEEGRMVITRMDSSASGECKWLV